MAGSCQHGKLREALVAYARSLGRERHDAEDIVHAALLKALEKYGEDAFSKLGLPYLKVMVKNLHIDGKRRTKMYPDEEIVEDFPGSEEGMREQERFARLERALEKHKYGYIVLEMEKRGLRRIKELAPYMNERKEKLYKRYRKLLKDLRKEFLKEG